MKEGHHDGVQRHAMHDRDWGCHGISGQPTAWQLINDAVKCRVSLAHGAARRQNRRPSSHLTVTGRQFYVGADAKALNRYADSCEDYAQPLHDNDLKSPVSMPGRALTMAWSCIGAY